MSFKQSVNKKRLRKSIAIWVKSKRKVYKEATRKKEDIKKRPACQPLRREVISPISKRNRRIFVHSIHKAKRLVNSFCNDDAENLSAVMNMNVLKTKQ